MEETSEITDYEPDHEKDQFTTNQPKEDTSEITDYQPDHERDQWNN